MPINKTAIQRALEKMNTAHSDTENTWLLKQLVDALSSVGKVSQIKGEKGDKPVAGIDYPIPKNGRDGRDGVDGTDGAKPIAGIDYPIPKNGKDGERGAAGKDGKDANITEVTAKAEKVARAEVKDHDKKYDHKLLHDSKELGRLTLDEETLAEGKILQVQKGKLVGVELPDYAKSIQGLRQQFARPAKSHSRYKIQTITASATADPLMNVVLLDASAGDIVVTLYEASGNEGSYTFFKRIDDADSNGNNVTFATQNSETIDFQTIYALVNRGSGCEVFTDGSNFFLKHT